MMDNHNGKPTLALVVQGRGDGPVAYACGDCGTVHGIQQKDSADQCCQPWHCKECGAETRRYWTACDECRRLRWRQKEEARFRAATVVPWDEDAGVMLYDEEHDRWVTDEEDALDWDNPTRYAYATTPIKPFTDASDLIENALQDHHEDAGEDIHMEDIKRLQGFLDAWWEGTGVVSYQPDYSRVVVLDRALERVENTKGDLS